MSSLRTVKKKFKNLKQGDTVFIGGKPYDVLSEAFYDKELEAWVFEYTHHKTIESIESSTYLSPADIGYEYSYEYENNEIDCVLHQTQLEIFLNNKTDSNCFAKIKEVMT